MVSQVSLRIWVSLEFGVGAFWASFGVWRPILLRGPIYAAPTWCSALWLRYNPTRLQATKRPGGVDTGIGPNLAKLFSRSKPRQSYKKSVFQIRRHTDTQMLLLT